MKNFSIAVAIAFVIIPSVFGQTDAQLVAMAKEAFAARTDAGGLANKEEGVGAFRKPFQGVSDSKRIRALALSLYAIDESDPKWSMSSSITMGASYALGDDPNFISDWSSLREMLKVEKSPRKFYLLSKLAPWTTSDRKHDFVAERTHMLFADGRVAKDEGEYTKSYAHDVSAYAYKAIVGNLKALGADFEPPAKDLPHEEQAVILAKWLKENWPRCEHIKIPRRLLGEESRPRKALIEDQQLSPSRIKEREKKTSQEAKPQNEESRLPWIIAGVLLVGILLLLLKIFKSKSTS